MKKYQFRSNINCSGCIFAVTPFLDANSSIKNWHVDITHPKKVLTVETETLTAEEVKHLVNRAGFKTEQI
ncbi:MAG TPA: heavy-metal-associated domain-containing protein [Puia sp.]|jgi:copper chaperone CopZ|nr:heavy-metal-associated domain-containing protein [Puia sp.]